jgi:hypothetical protein
VNATYDLTSPFAALSLIVTFTDNQLNQGCYLLILQCCNGIASIVNTFFNFSRVLQYFRKINIGIGIGNLVLPLQEQECWVESRLESRADMHDTSSNRRNKIGRHSCVYQLLMHSTKLLDCCTSRITFLV